MKKPGEYDKEDFEKDCHDLGGVKVSHTGNQGTLGQWENQYYVHYAGEQKFLGNHLKKGSSKDPSKCLRIYFFWDDETEKVVVGSMTEHLTNTKS